MVTQFPVPFDLKVRPILGMVESTGVPARGGCPGHPNMPFVTISRQAGAGGHTLARALVERLNVIDPCERPWESFDRELVEKVAADHHISTKLIDSLEDTSTRWLSDFFSGLAAGEESPNEMQVFHRLCATVRALAQAGRVVLVGCGAGYITSNMPGGVHLRLVAKLNHRIATMSKLLNVGPDAAAAEVRRMDRGRESFYKRYWPDRPLTAEQFTMVLNSSAMSEEEMVAAVLPVVAARAGAAVTK